MENSIRHDGIVESIKDNHIQVKIIQHSACSSCKVASHCNASESKVKIVDVYDCHRTDLHIGDSVTVSASTKTAGRALLLGFGLPLLLMIVTISSLLAWNMDEGIAALSGIGILIPYYLTLWAMRKKISQSISFAIE